MLQGCCDVRRAAEVLASAWHGLQGVEGDAVEALVERSLVMPPPVCFLHIIQACCGQTGSRRTLHPLVNLALCQRSFRIYTHSLLPPTRNPHSAALTKATARFEGGKRTRSICRMLGMTCWISVSSLSTSAPNAPTMSRPEIVHAVPQELPEKGPIRARLVFLWPE